jgi:hypothetical protein
MTETELREALGEDTFEWLLAMSEKEIREVFREIRIPRDVDYRCNIFGTEYSVVSRFNGHSNDDLYHKLKRLLSEEVKTL